MYFALKVRSKVIIKILVCWAATFSINGTYILKMKFIIFNRDIKYSLEISLMSFVIQNVRPNYFSKELLKYIFMKLDFINIR